MSEAAARVPPTADYLCPLPTLAKMTPDQAPDELRQLARAAGVDFVLELKLETPAARWWLCTQGAPAGAAGAALPASWVVGAVTLELPGPDEGGYGLLVPCPADPADAQRQRDAVEALSRECGLLERQFAQAPSAEVGQRLLAAWESLRRAAGAGH